MRSLPVVVLIDPETLVAFFDRRLPSGGDVEFFELAIADISRRFGQQTAGLLRFREGDRITDRFFAGQQHHKAIETVGDAAVGWSTKVEGFQ